MASKATTEQAAAKFPLESLRKNCRAVFGVSSCVFAGATADLPDGEYGPFFFCTFCYRTC